ncbi:phosphotransferase [Saccharopolyspora sp. K220]|uniref:phosphotransferase n=1 Tax=Saccharopolyspora soli TaxID=2926618 RepID=UPI001F568E3A|nr:phosphotransferase [Saccharopolyspora soli]MCI2416100.1 phosphotransferase [Saccharopolyspora soli]
MEHLPDGLAEQRLLDALGDFGIGPATATYAPVGFGDYHWKITGADGQRWFATVADLEHKEHCGGDAATALDGLRRAMNTAANLRERGLRFVVAPLRATSGDPVVPLDDRYALSVFPYATGETGNFDQELTAAQRVQVLDLLAELHSSTPPETTPVTALPPLGRSGLESTMDELRGTWEGGPFAEPARELLAENADLIRTRLHDFDRLADAVQQRGAQHVVTHGEPHPGNLLRGSGGYSLVDWDTVGLAIPERDLSVLSDDPATFTRYTATTGHTPDAAALDLYRLRWSLVDVAEFVAWFRGPHSRNPDTEKAWQGFTETLNDLTRTAR